MERALIDSRYKGKFSECHECESRYFDYSDHSGLLEVEENAMLIMELINVTTFERTRDVIQIDYKLNEDVEVTILVTKEAYEFRLATIEWTKGSYAPVKTSKLWKTLEVKGLDEEEIKNKLLQLVKEAIKKMKGDLVTCRYCKEKFHPSRTIGEDVCHSCAARHLGVVF